MRIGKRCKVSCSNITLKDGLIPWNFEIKYLGVVLSQASYLKINLHSNKVGFFRSFNGIFAKIGNSNIVDTIVELMKCNCLSVLLYCLEAVNLTKTDLNYLQFPLHRAFMKIFHVKDNVSIGWCQYYMHQMPIKLLLDAKKFNFYKKMSKSDCYLMQHLYAHAACNLFSDLTAKYNLNNNASIGRFRFELWATFHADLVNL